MANRNIYNKNIDESIRKPRRTRGTPFYVQRNLIALGAVAFGCAYLYLFELWPKAKQFKKAFLEGKFSDSPEVREHSLETQLSTKEPGYWQLIAALKARQDAREDAMYQEARPQSWYSRLFTGRPDFKTKKISKYFVTKNKNQESSEEMSDSPYKNCINSVKTMKLNNSSDLDDFKTPEAMNKKTKIVRKPEVKKVKKKKTRQQPLRNFLEDNLNHADVNPNHLQLALALSESSFDSENPKGSQEKRESFKKAFEMYGFGYSKNKKVPVEHKKSKNSRYRYVTPILKIRTEEERQSLISAKVSLIITQNCNKSEERIFHEKFDLDCEWIKLFKNDKIFSVNRMGLEELNQVDFYVGGLEIEKSEAVCGCLLRDWGAIPGRERSLERETSNQEEKIADEYSKNVKKLTENRAEDLEKTEVYTVSMECFDGSNIVSSSRRLSQKRHRDCLSPDLFDSDEEPKEKTEVLPSSVNRLRGGNDVEIECFDLTQSDDDDNLNQSKNRDENTSFHVKISDLEGTTTRRSDLNVTDYVQNLLSNYKTAGSDDESHESLKKYWLSNEEFGMKEESLVSRIMQNFETNLSARKSLFSLNEESSFSNTPPLEDTFNKASQFQPEASPDKIEKISTSEDESAPSQESINISDDELNYSSAFSAATSKKYQFSDEEFEEKEGQEERSKDCAEFFDDNVRISNQKIAHLSYESINISDDELSYSNATVLKDNQQSDEEFGLKEESLAERIKRKSEEKFQARKSLFNLDKMSGDVAEVFDENPKIFPLEDSFTGQVAQIQILEAHLKKTENISSSEDESQPGQESIEINDHELKKISPRIKHNLDCGEFSADNSRSPLEKNSPLLEDSLNGKIAKIPTPCAEKTDKIASSDNDLKTHYFSDEEFEIRQESLLDRIKQKSTDLSPKENRRIPFSNISVEENVPLLDNSLKIQTPDRGLCIKTKNVTPMADYDKMDTSKVVEELDKFGLKPLKRQKGIKLLKYIYESTHPIVDENMKNMKKNKLILGDLNEEDIIFERKISKRVASCAVPLHIAWHNLLMSNEKIRESVLLYEPLQLEFLHSMLKEQGYKYNIKDLLAFLDKKCITIRTAQGQHQGKNHK